MLAFVPPSPEMNARLCEWAAHKILPDQGGAAVVFGPHAQAFGVLDRADTLVAAVIWHNFKFADCEMSAVSDAPGRWMNRGVIRACLSYPFLTLGFPRITTINGRRNKRAHRALKALGFKLEGVHRYAYDGTQDAFSFGMTREAAARWIPELRGDAR